MVLGKAVASHLSAMSSRRVRHEAQRLEILEAAAAAIAEHGFHGMTMRGLARATGKGLATFYNYFSSKEDVLFSLQTEAFETMTSSVKAGLENITEPSDRLHAFVLNHLRFLAERRSVMRVLVHEASALPAGKRKTVRLLKEDYFKICRDIVAAISADGCGAPDCDTGRDAAEVERITYSVFGMLNWSYGWYDPRQHGTPHDVARTIHALAVNGLVGGRRQTRAIENPDRPLGGSVRTLPAGRPGAGAVASNKRQQTAERVGKDSQARKTLEQNTV